MAPKNRRRFSVPCGTSIVAASSFIRSLLLLPPSFLLRIRRFVYQQTTMVLRTRIGPDGSIISDGDESSSGGGGGSGGGGRRRLCPTTVDTFGFHLELKHFAIVLLLVSVTMGPIGSELYPVYNMLWIFKSFRSPIY